MINFFKYPRIVRAVRSCRYQINTRGLRKQWFIAIILQWISLYLLTFVIAMPWLCQNWTYSPYFNDDSTRNVELARMALQCNDERQRQATDYLSMASSHQVHNINREGSMSQNSQSHLSADTYDIVLAILTADRQLNGVDIQDYSVDYLKQSVAYFHREITQNLMSGFFVHLVVCDGTYDAPLSKLEQLTDVVKIFSLPKKVASNLKKVSYDDVTLFDKQKTDYTNCLLTITATYNSSYYGILEDDVIATRGFVKSLHSMLFTSITHHKTNARNIVFGAIKMYYPDRWRGYSFTYQTAVELFGIVALSCTVIPPMTRCQLKFLKVQQANLSKRKLLLITAIGAFWVALVCLSVGRQYVHDRWRTWLSFPRLLYPAPGCCTQAVLYPSPVVPVLTSYLNSIKCTMDFSIDLAIDGFMRNRNYTVFFTEPNLVLHIGLISSVRVWAKRIAEFLC